MKKIIILMVIVAGFGFMSCEQPTTGSSANVENVEIQHDGSVVYTQNVNIPVEITWSDGYVESDSVGVSAPESVPGVASASYERDGVEDSVDVNFDKYVASINIEYDGSVIYTQSVDLPVEITWSDGYVETDSVTVEGPADGPGIVPVTYDAIGSSSTHATTSVEFEDWRLVGTWSNSDNSKRYTIREDGTYDHHSDPWEKWDAEIPGEEIVDGNWYTENGNIYFEDHDVTNSNPENPDYSSEEFLADFN